MKAGSFVILCVALVANGVVRADDTLAQAAARAAMAQKMSELDQAEVRPSPDTNVVAPMEIPINDASAAARPVTVTPAAEVPAAVAPAMAPAAVAPVSAAPAVVTPVPRVSAAPAIAAAVSIAPAPGSEPASAFPASSARQERPSNELLTTTGATYKNVEVQKVTSEGIIISYTPAQGGWAMTRINFEDLPPDIRQKYGKP
jgi:hypothetical protein